VKLILIRQSSEVTLRLVLKHLPGRHDQSTHGRGWRDGAGRRRDGRGRFSSGSGSAGGYRAAPRMSMNDWKDEDLAPAIAALTSIDAAKDRDDGLKEIYRKQGFDALPELGDVDEVVKNGGTELFRGLSGDDAEQYAEQFKTGDYFAGLGVFGNGTYSSTNLKDADKYGKTIIRMALRPNAKVIGHEELMKATFDHLNEAMTAVAKLPLDEQKPGRQLGILTSDFGRFAAMNGYDAILAKGAGKGDFLIVLNRSAVVVEA